MGFHEFANMSVQSDYEVRRTGLNRLSIIINGIDDIALNPRLIINGDDAILVHDERNSVVLPEFPQKYVAEMLQSRTVLIGEKEPEPQGPMTTMFSPYRTPIRRFYEALVCISQEGVAASEAGKTIQTPQAANA